MYTSAIIMPCPPTSRVSDLSQAPSVVRRAFWLETQSRPAQKPRKPCRVRRCKAKHSHTNRELKPQQADTTDPAEHALAACKDDRQRPAAQGSVVHWRLAATPAGSAQTCGR